ncbi:unnamed protein product [Caretta caretta]
MYEHHTHQERVMGMLGGLWHLKQVSGFEGEAKKERDQLSYGLSGVKSRTMREKAGWGQDLGKTGASRASLRDWKNMGDLDFEYLRTPGLCTSLVGGVTCLAFQVPRCDSTAALCSRNSSYYRVTFPWEQPPGGPLAQLTECTFSGGTCLLCLEKALQFITGRVVEVTGSTDGCWPTQSNTGNILCHLSEFCLSFARPCMRAPIGLYLG